MGIINLFKKKPPVEEKVEPEEEPKKVEKKKVKEVKKEEKKVEKKQPAKPEAKKEIKGKTKQAYRVLVKPLVTEKAADLGAYGKYVFAIDSRMNKIEVKKAIRTIYGVDPVKVNISNISGKSVRFGRIWGKTKNWKKAVITLKPGDKIEIYEGV